MIFFRSAKILDSNLVKNDFILDLSLESFQIISEHSQETFLLKLALVEVGNLDCVPTTLKKHTYIYGCWENTNTYKTCYTK